jgi:hypothetical protein
VSINEYRDRVRAARDCGVVHIEFRRRAELTAADDPRDVADALVRTLGLRPLGGAWREITRAAALASLRDVLERDRAYGAELMSAVDATSLADEFLDRFDATAQFYTNGTFPQQTEPHTDGWAGSWDPITQATFDTGVVAVDERAAGLLWVEDED